MIEKIIKLILGISECDYCHENIQLFRDPFMTYFPEKRKRASLHMECWDTMEMDQGTEAFMENCEGGALDPEACCYSCGMPRCYHKKDAKFHVPDETMREIVG